jgi:hypothetical protein
MSGHGVACLISPQLPRNRRRNRFSQTFRLDIASIHQPTAGYTLPPVVHVSERAYYLSAFSLRKTPHVL